MTTDRRTFLRSSVGAAALAAVGLTGCASRARSAGPAAAASVTDEQLKAILQQPVLRRDLFPDPVIIESLDLLKNGDEFIVRARSTDGAEGIAVSNGGRMHALWAFFVEQVAPFFPGKDARDLDRLIDEVFVYDSNYKYQGLGLWVPVASAEFAILDLLGQVSGRSVRELVGDVIRTHIDVYRANNFRGHSAEESVERIMERVRSEQPNAIKIKLGGRMSLPEEPPGRTEKLIPMVRAAVGDDMVIYSDANGSYDVEEAVRVGRLLEEIDAAFFEEPCPFDWLWETKEVSDRLTVPVAGGEQESSMRRFRWMVANDGLQVFQPDLFYFGGLIRSMKVARMAEAVGKPCTPHISGWGLGMLYVLHYASVVPNPGPHQEYKGVNRDIPFESSSSLALEDGQVAVPTGPGWGVRIDPEWIARSRVLTV